MWYEANEAGDVTATNNQLLSAIRLRKLLLLGCRSCRSDFVVQSLFFALLCLFLVQNSFFEPV